MVFIPFCFAEAAANVLTNPQLDPFGKIPEFKFSAASVQKANVAFKLIREIIQLFISGKGSSPLIPKIKIANKVIPMTIEKNCLANDPFCIC